MKQTILSILVAGSMMTFVACGDSAPKEAETVTPAGPLEGEHVLNVDKSVSTVRWSGSVLGVKEHSGTIMIKDGTVSVKDGKITGGNFTIDMATITPTDANYDEKSTKENLVGHLSSPDFFDVPNNPTATFTITEVNGDTAKGTLFVRGKSNEEKITDVKVTPEGNGARITGKLKFDRQKYGVSFDAGKDMVLSDDIVIDIDMLATK